MTRVSGAESMRGTTDRRATMVDMSRISRRVDAITESATLAVDAKAKALQAAGEDVVGFGAGEPDFPTPAPIVEAAAAACADPRNHKYTPTPGLPELRAAIAEKTRRDSGYEVDASQVVVTNGGKHAVYNAFQVLLDPGDEVIIPAPYWTTYPEAVKLAVTSVLFQPAPFAPGERLPEMVGAVASRLIETVTGPAEPPALVAEQL